MSNIMEFKNVEYSKNRFIPDTSVILSGQIIDYLESGKIYENNQLNYKDKIQIVLSRIVIAELENQANQDKATGIIGIDILTSLRKTIEKMRENSNSKIEIITYGERPSLEQIKLNSGGELDAAVRQHARETGSIIISSDKVLRDLCLIENIPVIYIAQDQQKKKTSGMKIQDFFDDTSMSVHLKTGCVPFAKKGKPGQWSLEKIGSKILSIEEIKQIESNIISEAESDSNSFIEKEMKGVTVVQLRNYRIVICRPPFSDSNEITAVKPLVRLSLDYYKLSNALIPRLEKAEGILVAGSPGAGKSTFISALAEFYLTKNKVIKTLESVRDLQVPPEVSQYSDLEDDFEKTADILLLLRPDYTIFDEIRTSGDFKIYADMRLAGVGMVGVIHASSAVDAIQRFIRRVELGMLPSVVDTIIFIRNGQITEILKIEIVVKVPTGITDAGLARPVIEVSDYITNKLEYEIYEFGSNIVVTPVKSRRSGRNMDRDGYENNDLDYGYKQFGPPRRKKGTQQKGKKGNTNDRGSQYSHDTYRYNDDPLEDSGKVSQSNNAGIDNLKQDLKANTGELSENSDILELNDGNIDLNEIISENNQEIRKKLHLSANQIEFGVLYSKKSLVLKAPQEYKGNCMDIYAGDQFIGSISANQIGEIHIEKKTHMYHKLDELLEQGLPIIGVPLKK
jgi:ATPase